MFSLELVGVISGLAYVLLAIRQNVWCWPIGLVNAGTYSYVFFQSRLYADFGLQLFYVAITFYGWFKWLRGGPGEEKLRVSRVGTRLALFLAVLGIFATTLMGWALTSHTDADLPYWDSTTTVMSLIAQFMTARKHLESWLVWIAANTLFVGIYLYKDLYLTSVLYALFLVLAIEGFRQWKKEFAASP